MGLGTTLQQSRLSGVTVMDSVDRIARVLSITAIVLSLGALADRHMTYNPDTGGIWVANYGVELAGPNGVELVNCYQVPNLFITTEVDC